MKKFFRVITYNREMETVSLLVLLQIILLISRIATAGAYNVITLVMGLAAIITLAYFVSAYADVVDIMKLKEDIERFREGRGRQS